MRRPPARWCRCSPSACRTSATAAIMLAGFQQYGLQPGPLLFATNPQLVWGLIASLLIANFMLLILNLPLVGLWVKLLTIPKPWLYAGILVFATLGTIGANPSVFELGMLLVFGLVAYVMRVFDYPIAPVIVGLILGRSPNSSAPRAGDQPGRYHDDGTVADRRRPARTCSHRPRSAAHPPLPRTRRRSLADGSQRGLITTLPQN